MSSLLNLRVVILHVVIIFVVVALLLLSHQELVCKNYHYSCQGDDSYEQGS